jgi:hypothetical protein
MSTNRRAHEPLPAWIENHPEPTVIGFVVGIVLILAAFASPAPMKIGI